jgi:hypothetical protein
METKRKPHYKIYKTLKEDIWNWQYQLENHNVFGFDFRDNLGDSAELKFFDSLLGKKRGERAKALREYLTQKYYETGFVDEQKQKLEMLFTDKFDAAMKALQEITGRPLYFTDFIVYITTFPGEPFGMDFDKHELTLFASPRLNSKIGSAIDGLLHEALHGETIYYWRDKIDLPDEQFNDLREALTVVLDESLMPAIMSEPDSGYPAHQELRKRLHIEWKKTHDFDKLVHFGADLIKGGILVS